MDAAARKRRIRFMAWGLVVFAVLIAISSIRFWSNLAKIALP